MKKTLPRLLIVAIVLLEFVWLATPRIGSHPVSPRLLQAMESHKNAPKSEQDAAIAEAIDRDAVVAGRWAIAVFALVIGVNIALIYCFWNYGTRRTTA